MTKDVNVWGIHAGKTGDAAPQPGIVAATDIMEDR